MKLKALRVRQPHTPWRRLSAVLKFENAAGEIGLLQLRRKGH